MSFLGGSSSPSSAETKAGLMLQVQQEAAMNNARLLIQKVNDHCFEACVPSPGASMSAQENTCVSSCMNKYISTWNIISRSYISRVAVESKKAGDANVIASLGSGL
ncbi:mitochondrial intermembrane space translocase subunit Tim13 [Penicillium verhagenii]|uniref:mitochondrial intermembrane space translocase subunit Tim13 n=1 Tax=Penicillium verhagenii TaxID=1562060 RepID=UPI002544F1E9|nr:mitochondrial intermembrane space translocase subunit Tim13 [Penicillium verhagenii]KAJ5923914.1 mitochondrial intermembrane space translocase subunit Tim13 [Penicillium verhagenii]